jgi:hypothetical protein
VNAPKIIGELVYDFVDKNGVPTTWRAEVERASAGYALYICLTDGGRFQAGMYATDAALVKFVRSEAEKRFGRTAKPKIDTLDKIGYRKGATVIPACHIAVEEGSLLSGGRGLEACPKCPYRYICGQPENTAQPKVANIEESQEMFLQRLRSKVAARGKAC